MEMVLCKKYTDRIELLVAVQYYGQDSVCRSCLNFDLCRETKEEQDGKAN